MSSLALQVALELARSLHAPLKQVARRDPTFARQLRDAATCVAVNVEAADQHQGTQRLHFLCVAAGSADEVRVSLCVAQAWRYVDGRIIARALALARREVALLHQLGLTLSAEKRAAA